MQSGTKRLCASRVQNDPLETTQSHSVQHWEVLSTKGRYIDAYYIKYVKYKVLNLRYCAREEQFTLLSSIVI